MRKMHDGSQDNNTVLSRTNYMVDGENTIQMANSSFLPSVELVDWFNDPFI